jgi:transmembrane sensor
MNTNRIKYLLDRFKKDKCTQAELEELNDWYHSLKGGRSEYEAWLQDAGGEDKLRELLYSRFTYRINKKPVIRQINTWYRVAAILCVFITTGYLFFFRKEAAVEQTLVQAKKPMVISPGKDRAVLTMADGRQLVLDSSPNGELANEQGVQISKLENGQLVYKYDGSSVTSAALQWNMINIPRAGQFQLVLPDGTKAWLNSETQLRFPVRFTGAERKVILTGEAYFEVAHNARMPFKVESAGQTVTVLGTHFNVKAYGDEHTMVTTLLEGRVRVDNPVSHKNTLLTPGLQASVIRNKGDIKIASAPLEEVMAWKNGYFIFDNEDIHSIMRIISRWYDVDVDFNINKPIRLGGTFSKSSNLEQLLKNFSLVSDARFELKERRIIVSN